MTCDDFQIASDQHLAGAASAISRDELDAHLATCAACTAYVSLSRKVSSSMINTLSMSAPPLDLAAMRARVTQLRGHVRRLPAIAAGGWFCVFALATNLTVHRSVGAVLIQTGIAAAFASIMYAFTICLRPAEARRLAALESRSGSELVAGLRTELDGMIRLARRQCWLLPLLAAILPLNLFVFASPSGTTSMILLIAIEVGFVALVPLSMIRYRRFVRERAQLD